MFKKEKLKDLHYVVSGVLTAAEIAEKSDAILLKYGERAKIPGFRPGHIPIAVLRQRYGGDAAQDAVNELMNADMDAFVLKRKIRLAGRPKADLEKYAPGADAEYLLNFDILPNLPKIDFERITVAKKETPVDPKEIETAIENIRKSRANFETQAAGYKLAKGDIAVIDFTGYLDDEKFEGGEGKNHSLTLGGGQFIPGFEDQVIGHAAGDEFDVNIKFPEIYRSEKLAGKPARFSVKIIEAKKAVLPELNGDLAKSVGVESMEKLREDVEKMLSDRNAENDKAARREELLDILADKVKLDLPESLVEAELAAAEKKDDAKKARKDAERRVKLGLILAEWGQQNEVKVEREELQSAIWTEASRCPNPQEVYELYNKNPNGLSMLNGMLFERKTLDAMLAKCKVK